MRVIKHGNQLLYQEQEHTCIQCGCIFKYTLSDIENYINYKQEEKEFTSKIGVKCPECHLAFFIEPAAADPEEPQNEPEELEPVDPSDINPDPDPEPVDPEPVDPEPIDPEPIDPDGGD